jgi:hypothetical protein
MMETALVFDTEGHTLYWHEPLGRTGISLPCSHDLWQVLWEHRAILGGVAHTHPWAGPAQPSSVDLETFQECEKNLFKKNERRQLIWPVVTFTDQKNIVWDKDAQLYVVAPGPLPFEIEGIEELRERSRT